ncbi:SET domain-containing protein [Trichoderma breve]|uniref:SET domain-containing protein n=1 Tax=Trichoderma breve TaxID=2034170 RepID=A0A9W9E8W2_9HYPO|nr:SET domain-containing protein [Trichoderma breve]KAJ4862429.1 SET domain-containing protein [Trichoderma breve]
MASRLPLRRDEWAISNSIPLTVDRYPATAENYKTRHKSLSVDLSWLLDGRRDAAECEVAEEEESTSSISDTKSDILSSGDATCEFSDTMSETPEMEPNDTCEIPVDTDNTDVDLEIPKAIKAALIPPAIIKTSPEPMYGNEYFEIAKSSVAGWGAFATRDLTKGGVILREIPLFVAETDKVFHEFYKLDESAKKVALSLHSHRLIKGGTPQILAVWQTNCFAVAHRVSGLFPIAARFNHACDPINNVEYEFDHDNGVLTMMVREDVAAGTELKISYGKNLSPQDFNGFVRSLRGDMGNKFYIILRPGTYLSDVVQETHGGGDKIHLPWAYDIEDVQRLVDYLYTGDYKTTPSDSSEKQDKASELIAHGNLLGLAGEYNIHGLNYLAQEKVRAAIQDEPETSALIECIPKVYESVMNPDSMIFNLMIESIRERIGRTPPDRNTRSSLDSAMQEVPDFARGLAMSFVTQ